MSGEDIVRDLRGQCREDHIHIWCTTLITMVELVQMCAYLLQNNSRK